MSDYTEQELHQMQEDAIRRVREMQQRAERTARQQGWTGSAPQPPPQSQPPQAVPNTAQPGAAQPNAEFPLAELFRGQTSSPLSGLMQWAGGERGILLALLAVLMGEGADPALLLALFYLAMFDDAEDEGEG